MMLVIIALIPFMALMSAIYLYGHRGKREILKLDLVQFIYAFVIAPIFIVWFKSFLFYLLRNEVDQQLTLNDLFWIDTFFVLIGIFMYAFIVIHSLTKSFELKMFRDPLHDLFEHSEYFHLWASHLALHGGVAILMSGMASLNILVPLTLDLTRFNFYLLVLIGLMSGIAIFFSVWKTEIDGGNYLRVMKLIYGLIFVGQVGAYFVFEPAYGSDYLLYWLSLMAFTAFVICSLFIDRIERRMGFVGRLRAYLKRQRGATEVTRNETQVS